MKDFVRAKGCYRVAAYKTFYAAIEPLELLHDCCLFCSKTYKCGGVQCDEAVLPFEETMQEDSCSDEIRNSQSVVIFKSKLKTYLFKLAYNLL